MVISVAPLSYSESLTEAHLAAERVKEGWATEKRFRVVFERLVFDMGMDPEAAEQKTLKIIEILKNHEYKEPR